ncbi:DUF4142 domain-containing protein [Novosphingobium flavum]|uniref:DUF4142 domain-containing protein n=1 Tax=Novosphingobium flavum TaxID=1778672 RepID=A0A7X1KMW3_9SPHN|nr:DUF4142 domain-containing protein [Novosphingobium flavum]MBC2666720.1 DUF4142 domain-containing protein [Novosphingobium flavum]
MPVLAGCGVSHETKEASISEDFSGQAVSPAQFVDAASQLYEYQVSAARLAITNSIQTKVEYYAYYRVKEAERLKGLLGEAAPGKAAAPLNAAQIKSLTELGRLFDFFFDEKYVRSQIAVQKSLLTLMDNYSRQGDDPALKAFAARNLPIVRGNLLAAQGLMSVVHGPETKPHYEFRPGQKRPDPLKDHNAGLLDAQVSAEGAKNDNVG